MRSAAYKRQVNGTWKTVIVLKAIILKHLLNKGSLTAMADRSPSRDVACVAETHQVAGAWRELGTHAYLAYRKGLSVRLGAFGTDRCKCVAIGGREGVADARRGHRGGGECEGCVCLCCGQIPPRNNEARTVRVLETFGGANSSCSRDCGVNRRPDRSGERHSAEIRRRCRVCECNSWCCRDVASNESQRNEYVNNMHLDR